MLKVPSQKTDAVFMLQHTSFSIIQDIPASRKRNLPNRVSKSYYAILIGTIALLLGAALLVFLLQPEFEKVRLERLSTSWGTAIVVIGLALLVLKIASLFYLLFLYLRYKPVNAVTDEMLPSCTVIVPAYNEGKLVFHTLMSLAESDYPHEKIQMIAINDGSIDDTWQWMQLAKEQLGDRLAIYQQSKNMGKRHALYRGFKLGTGAVFVTVDSDSIVKKDTLRNMVSPFVVNEKCGAVAGNVAVLNKQALIPKMLNVSFAFSFEFIRSAQSVLGSVFCTPGALAAYRKDAVLNCLDKWLHQTFMGKASDIGEDRAMTNMILKQGLHVLFQRNAFVYTNTPERYKGLYKMFIRWERSNVRESMMMGKFLFGNFRQGHKMGSRILLIDQWLKLLLSIPALLLMCSFVLSYPLLFISSALLTILIFSSIPAFFYAKRHNVLEAFWAYPYSVFYLFTLFWVTPYSIVTAGRRGWLTRELPQKDSSQI